MQNIVDLKSTRLLLVESDPANSRQMLALLREAAETVTVTAVSTLAEALEAASKGTFDIVLLNLQLTDGQGVDVLTVAQRHLDGVPILVVGGLQEDPLAKLAVAQGAQDYLVQGEINVRALRRVLSYTLERHSNEQFRRQLERDRAQSRTLESVGQLAAGIAHEINTPTQYVSDNTQFLRDALVDLVAALEKLRGLAGTGNFVDSQQLMSVLALADVDYLIQEIPRALDQSISGLGHISRIVRAMKEFSHPSGAEKVPTDINRALETTVVVASNEWKYVADVVTDFDPTIPQVICLPGEMNQVFLNLIVNAAHAIGDVVKTRPGSKGRITLRTKSLPDGQVEIQVSDTGCGIPAEFRDRVFEPFFTTKEVGKGTGQGLAIAYDVVVRKHHGSLQFDSCDGGGTCFSIRFPVQPHAHGSPKSN